MLAKTPNIKTRQLVIIRADFSFFLLGSNINCECSISKAKAKETKHCKYVFKFAWNIKISNWNKLMTIPYNLVSIPRLLQLLALITSLATSLLLLVEEPMVGMVKVLSSSRGWSC